MSLHSTDRSRLLIEAARLYYEHNLNQAQIATRLDVSRPGVSRLLQEARDAGIVKIQIIDPGANGTRLESALRDKYGLKHAIVVPSDKNDTVLKSRMGSALITLLDQLLTENTTLGVSWGSTLQAATQHLNPRLVKNMTVVQLNGGVSKAELDTHATEIAGRIGENYQAIPYLLPLPAIVDTAELKKAIISDRNIAKTLKLAREADIAVFTVGAFGSKSVLVQADYFEEAEVQALIQAGAVADICSRLIKADGSICSTELDDRTIGIELAELKARPFSIAIAGGSEKARAIRAGLAGGYFISLITDEDVARQLLDGE
ncbi:MAG: sugar-binding transcriptional regulator [Candidatus Marinimicrobia bacterium]|nr:sugar-binding transcriptional regulator [Candidatus Neomarinimicrobiota bacterium]